MKRTHLRLVLIAALASACSSTSTHLARMYEQLQEDSADADASTEHDATLTRRQAARIDNVRKIVADKKLATAADHLQAAVILVHTDVVADLVLSHELALKAAELGENKGFRVAAEALDKQLLREGKPQKYGTQYVYEPVIQAWRLYVYEPGTTDVERKAMGVEPLAELLAKQEVLNARMGKKTR